MGPGEQEQSAVSRVLSLADRGQLASSRLGGGHGLGRRGRGPVPGSDGTDGQVKVLEQPRQERGVTGRGWGGDADDSQAGPDQDKGQETRLCL